MAQQLNPDIQFPDQDRFAMLGKILSFAQVRDDPIIPEALKNEYEFETQNVQDAERNIVANQGNERLVGMYTRMKMRSLRALKDINRRITNIRLGVNWV